jgi:uncharacterized protein YgiB involved in biofilm formation
MKRSAAISLVLAGTAASTLTGCGETDPQRDVYTSLANCQRDWNGPAQCEPVRDGRYASSYYYGPNHYGSSWPSGRPKASPSAFDSVRSPGSSVSASSVSRGGFGSTGRSFSSGS